MRKVYVVGASLMKVSRYYDLGLRELAYNVASKVLEEAGNPKVEALIVGNMLSSSLGGQDNLGSLLADYMGLCGIPALKVESGEASGGSAVYIGYNLVASGIHDVVMVCGVEKCTEHPIRTFNTALAQSLDCEYESYYGVTQASLAALTMQLYMKRYNVSRESLAEWPVLMHENASKNPQAMLRFRITRDQVLQSPPISEPIRLLDSHPVCDGAAAIILASKDKARKLTDTPIEIAACEISTDRVYYASREDPLTFRSTIESSRKACKKARIEIKDIGFVELHDDYTITGIIAIEDLGFTSKGETVKELLDGRFRPGDKPSINLSGGLKARGHPLGATGVYQIAELIMQLIGEFPGASSITYDVALAHSVGGYGSTSVVTILKR